MPPAVVCDYYYTDLADSWQVIVVITSIYN